MPGKQLQLFLKGLEGKTTTLRVDEESSIEELFKKVSKISGVPEDELRLLYTSKELRPKDDDGKVQLLSDYGIKDLGNLFLVLRLRGGSEEEEGSIVQPKMYDSEVQLTTKPDMFTLDDEEGGQRAEMPCGHAISPESLTAYCRSLLTVGRFEFRCPYKKNPSDPFCDRLWEFLIVKSLAVLTKAEIEEFESKIADNYLRKAVGIQECPRCQSFCERMCKTDRRVICPICTKAKRQQYEFCWYCLKTWLTSGAKECGNTSCTGQDPRLRIIRNCPTKTIEFGQLRVPNCPSLRACPKCGLLIEHREACKQMICPCGQKFCFICLKMAVNGKYQCGAWNTNCSVAPTQSAIPGAE